MSRPQGGAPPPARAAGRARALAALAVAGAACALGVGALGALTRRTAAGARLDVAGSAGFGVLEDPSQRDEALDFLAHVTDPLTGGLLLLALVLHALGAGRPGRAAAAAVVVAGAVVTTQVLQRPPLGAPFEPSVALADPTAYPSGHATGAMALGLGLVIVASHGTRLLAAVAAGAGALAQALAMLGQDWHRPSDVLAGHLVAGAWACAAVAALVAAAGRAPRLGDERGPWAAALDAARIGAVLVAAAALALLVGGGPASVLGWIALEPASALVLVLLAALAVALPALVAATVPGPRRRAR